MIHLFINKDKLFSELDSLDSIDGRKVHEIFRQHTFSKYKIKLYQEWIHQKPERNYKTWVYHEFYLPKGKVVSLSEAVELYQKGWTLPANFGKGLWGKWYKFRAFLHTTLKEFWLKHWQFLIGTTLTIIGLYIAWLAISKPK